ncbi:MAG: hypothetical protein JXA13_05590 [Anaerolineales bacterium]|nr:hypothetical protein [Anaerolineales bacterium]
MNRDKWDKVLLRILMTVWLSMFLLPAITRVNAASQATPPGPDRYTAITVEYTAYTWWMAAWHDNQVVCELVVDHEGSPTLAEIFDQCGEDVHDIFFEQQPCTNQQYYKKQPACEGYYLYVVDSQPAEREIAVKLSPPVVWVDVTGCTGLSTTYTNICEESPHLLLTGYEPLPNEEIISIEGILDGEPFSCDPECNLELPITGQDTISVEFWAFSSYGDSSELFEAQVRVAEVSNDNPDEKAWYVDVLSDQWIGQPVASCAESWESFPPVGGPPDWLITPKRSEDLNSNIPYGYLAGNLIRQGIVDAGYCPDGGLLPEGTANSCGMDAAQNAVEEWQNGFDERILEVATDTGAPAQLLKNLFARESQFWPGIYTNPEETGLGQLTDGGADITLLWNPSFFEQFCPLILSAETCQDGYLHMDEENKEFLRIALVQNANAYCPECPYGLDLTQADFSINVFAHTLLASCEQAGRVVRNVTGQAPGNLTGYEDMWKFSLVNYTAGPGCLYDAVELAWDKEKVLNWDTVSENLMGVCYNAVGYVEDIGKE